MDFFHANLTGLVLSSQNAAGPTATTLNLDNRKNLNGFLLFSDLDKLLNVADCVGIRVYNPVGKKRVVAAGVKADGFELDGQSYLMSQDIPSLAANASPTDLEATALTRRQAIAEVAPPPNVVLNTITANGFAAFFSKGMIDTLKSSGLEGVCFYELPMDLINADDLRNSRLSQIDSNDEDAVQALKSLVSMKVSLKTNLAVAHSPNNGFSLNDSPDLTRTHVISNLPCPGHCVVLKPSNRLAVEVAPAALSDNDDGDMTDPYIIQW